MVIRGFHGHVLHSAKQLLDQEFVLNTAEKRVVYVLLTVLATKRHCRFHEERTFVWCTLL